MKIRKEYKFTSALSIKNFLLTQHLAKNLDEIFLPALSNLLINTTNQFVAALQKDKAIVETKYLYDFILEIRAEINRR
jgi:hypothetical protein